MKAAVGGLEPRSAATYVAAVCGHVAAVGGLEPRSAATLPRSAASSRGRRPHAAVSGQVAAVGGHMPRSAARFRGRLPQPRAAVCGHVAAECGFEAAERGHVAADCGSRPPTAARGRQPRQPGRRPRQVAADRGLRPPTAARGRRPRQVAADRGNVRGRRPRLEAADRGCFRPPTAALTAAAAAACPSRPPYDAVRTFAEELWRKVPHKQTSEKPARARERESLMQQARNRSYRLLSDPDEDATPAAPRSARAGGKIRSSKRKNLRREKASAWESESEEESPAVKKRRGGDSDSDEWETMRKVGEDTMVISYIELFFSLLSNICMQG